MPTPEPFGQLGQVPSKMPGKINLYTLGSQGVDTTTSPVHGEDGVLASAQNAAPASRNEKGALTKRDGLSAINGSAAAGTIRGLVNVAFTPIINPTRTYWVGNDDAGGNAWVKSTGAFASGNSTQTVPQKPSRASNLTAVVTAFEALRHMGTAVVRNKIYFPGGVYTTFPSLRSYDGTNDLLEIDIQNHPSLTTAALGVVDMAVDGDFIYLAIFDAASGAPNYKGRILRYNTVTKIVTQLGEAFGGGTGEISGGFPNAVCVGNGFVWCGLYGGSGTSASKIMRIRPTIETTWTTDRSMSVGGVLGMSAYNGLIYSTHIRADAGTAATVEVRSGTGTWSTSYTADFAGLGNALGIPTVYSGNMYVVQFSGGANLTRIKKYDGTTWTTDYTHADQPSGVSSLIDNGKLFMALSFQSGFRSDVVVNTSGTWSTNTITAQAGTNGLRGPLGIITS